MIRKLQRWWQSQLGPAVRVKYTPGSGTWRVEKRSLSFGHWYMSTKQMYPLPSHRWNQDKRGNFTNINDAMECAKLEAEEERIRDLDERCSRVIAFSGRKVKW